LKRISGALLGAGIGANADKGNKNRGVDNWVTSAIRAVTVRGAVTGFSPWVIKLILGEGDFIYWHDDLLHCLLKFRFSTAHPPCASFLRSKRAASPKHQTGAALHPSGASRMVSRLTHFSFNFLKYIIKH
jgi:hypothetical protein